MNASCGFELTKFILKHSQECRHQSKPLPGTVKQYIYFFLAFLSPLTCAVYTSTISSPPHFGPITVAAQAVTYFPADTPGQYTQLELCSLASLQPLIHHRLTKEAALLTDRQRKFIKRRRAPTPLLPVILVVFVGGNVSKNSISPEVNVLAMRE